MKETEKLRICDLILRSSPEAAAEREKLPVTGYEENLERQREADDSARSCEKR